MMRCCWRRLLALTGSVLLLVVGVDPSCVVVADDWAELSDASRELVARRRENRSRLGDFRIVWDRTVTEDGYVDGRTGEYSASHVMWRRGTNVAISFAADSLTTTNDSRVATPKRDAVSYWAAFHDSQWRRAEPVPRRFVQTPYLHQPSRVTIDSETNLHDEENWLAMIGWNAAVSHPETVLDGLLRERADHVRIESWHLSDDGVLDAVLSSTTDRARLECRFNAARGGELERLVSTQDGGASDIIEYALHEVQPGCWMPIRVRNRKEGPGGRTSIVTESVVDLASSAFGPGAADDDRVFQIPVSGDIEVWDIREKDLARQIREQNTANLAGEPPPADIASTAAASTRWWFIVINAAVMILLAAWALHQFRRRSGK